MTKPQPLLNFGDPHVLETALEKPQAPPGMSPVMAQYWEVKQQYPTCLLFFRMGDFYEMFFEDDVIQDSSGGEERKRNPYYTRLLTKATEEERK